MENTRNRDGLTLTSILNLRILMFLDSKSSSAYFEDLMNYLNKSKSQISTSLSKLERLGLIARDKKRPQTISITEKGYRVKNRTLREIMKFKRKKENKSTVPSSSKKNSQKKQVEKENLFERFISDISGIILEELKEGLGNYIPMEIIDGITQQIKNRIHDKLYEFF